MRHMPSTVHEESIALESLFMFTLLLLAGAIRFHNVEASFLFYGGVPIHSVWTGLNSISSDENSLGSQKVNKKKKKNKYEVYSKYKLEKDPLDTLIAESLEKQKIFEDKHHSARRPILSDVLGDKIDENVKNPIFPDNKNIDPYDPTTYGFIELGKITAAHGVHGSVKVSAVTTFSERLCEPGWRHLKAPNRRSPRKILLIEGKKISQNEYLVRLNDINDRDSAMKLKDYTLYSRQEERPKQLGDDEYLVSDLVGMDVMLLQIDGECRTQINSKVGKISGIVFAEEMCSIPGLGNDLLEVLLPAGRSDAPWRDQYVLIPFVPTICPVVDLEGKVVYIDPPSGLLDLSYTHEENTIIKGFLPGTVE